MQNNPRFPKGQPKQSTQPAPSLSGKKKKKQRTNQLQAFWERAMYPVITVVPTPTAKAIQPFEVPKGPFLAPHQVKDTIDLTDDTAPAMGMGSWQLATPTAAPGTSGTNFNAPGNAGSNANVPGTSFQGQKYEQNRKPRKKHNRPGNVKRAIREEKLRKLEQQVNLNNIPIPTEPTATTSDGGIKWELNKVDDENDNEGPLKKAIREEKLRIKMEQEANLNNIPIPTEPTATTSDGGIKWELNKVDDENEDFTADLVAEAEPSHSSQSSIKLTIQPKKKAAPLNTQPAPTFVSESRWKPVTDKNKPQMAPTFVETTNTEKNKPKMAPTFAHKPKMAATFVETVENRALMAPKVVQVARNKTNNDPVKVEIVNTSNITSMSNTAENKNNPKSAPEKKSSPNKKATDTPKQAPKAIKITNIGGDAPKAVGAGAMSVHIMNRGPAGVPRSFLEYSWKKDQIMPQEHVLRNHLLFEPNIPRSIPTLHPAQSSQQQNQQQQMSFNQQPTQQQLFVDTSMGEPTERQQYSPSDVYDDSTAHVEQEHEDLDSTDNQSGQKRLSAFQRLGPVSQAKKPKLTINLTCDKEQSVREVLQQEEIIPVHLRQDIIESKDDIVATFRRFWPWKTALTTHRTVTARNSKSVMLLEQEQMEEVYERDSLFIQLTVKRYPPSWTKEDVLDTLLEAVKGKSFIPCFIEFNREECKFLVIRSKPALLALHRLGFSIRKDEVILKVSISKVDFTLHSADFLPRLVLRKILAKRYDSERSLDLRAFTLQSDISHFIYFPLNRLFNQMELVQLQSTVIWEYLTDLNLSHNRLTSIDGFDLPKMSPRLKNLDLSYNHLERATCILRCTSIALKTLKLEGNPLCHDYTDPDHYVRVVKMMFPTLIEIDGTPIKLKGDMPRIQRNYCPTEAKPVVDRFLEVYFPLLDSDPDDRVYMEDLYDINATLTVTYEYKLRFNPSCRYYRNLLLEARVFKENELHSIEGATAIAKHLCRWPAIMHDANSFTVDVLHHSENTTVLRISGIMKLTVDTLAEDEHMLAFTRTLVLTSKDGVQYKILNEMVYWETPSDQCADAAFKVNTVRLKRPSLKLDSAPNDDFKAELTKIFMKLTKLDRRQSEKCLETKGWNLKYSLEYFVKLLKLDGLSCLLDDVMVKK